MSLVRVVPVSQLLEVTVVIPQFQLVAKIRVFLDNVVDMPVGVSTSAWFRL